MKGGKMEDKIKKLIEKIEVLKNKLNKLQSDYNIKYHKVDAEIRITEEKILDLRMKLLKDKDIPKELAYEFGIRWISPDLDGEVMREAIEKVSEPISFPYDLEEEQGIEFLE